MKFLMIEHELLANEHYNTAEKLVLAYIISLHKQGKGFWGKLSYLADLFGTSKANIDVAITSLLNKEVIYRDSESCIRLAFTVKAAYDYKTPSTRTGVNNILQELSNKMNINNQ